MAVDELPDLRALELFVSAVELGSMSQAAARHGLSQPAASMRISALERRLGLQLLVRTSTGSQPTDAGSVIATWARELLEIAARMGGAIQSLKHTASESTTLAASLTVAEQLMPRWLAWLQEQRPHHRFQVLVANSAAVIEHVRDGRASLGFIESPQRTLGLKRRTIGTDRLVVAVAAGHPWTRRRTPIEPRHLADTPLVLREEGSGTRETLRSALQAIGLTLGPPALELSSTAALRNAVAAGVAPTVISQLSIRDDLVAGRLAIVATTGVEMTRPLTAIWRGTAPSALALIDRFVPRASDWRGVVAGAPNRV
jgi:DNA-binding transcriptional LysR family regulator